YRSAQPTSSLAGLTYWSRGAIRWGAAGPVRYRLRPVSVASGPDAYGPDRLRTDLALRLVMGDIEFELGVQRYVSEILTPVEDTSKRWVGPWEPVARLIVPRQNLDTAEARLIERRVGRLAFNPWNTTEEFRPLGNLNRARRAAYEASSAHRLGQRFITERPGPEVVLDAAAGGLFRLVNRVVPWHRLPTQLSLVNLSLIRRRLKRDNLIDTEPQPSGVEVRSPDSAIPDDALAGRTYDGTYNDLSVPRMGAVGATFGRDMPMSTRQDDLPDPIRVSTELLSRERFIPARSLNVLAAAWIQFQVHDWVIHRRYPLAERSIDVPITDGREWRNTPNGPLENVMRIAENVDERNATSHWWDGSEIYGASETIARSLREQDGTGARLCLANGYLPTGDNGLPLAGFTDSWWLGLSTMQTLFAREHNAVCDALEAEYPNLTEEQTYQTARLIVAALIAKIHTVEWTPAILPTGTIDAALSINWRGAPDHWLTRLGLRLFDSQAFHGISGSVPDHDGVPFSLTEEFVTVYRMHPLIPDDYVFVDHKSGDVRHRAEFPELQGRATEPFLRKIGLADTVYSLGIANPGAVRLHNFPRSLQRFERDGEIVDLSVVDIVRTRRRGVPRYNDFRVALHMPRISRFEELTTDPTSLARLRELYTSVDRVDTVVGLLAEDPPTGFGFSDTAFRIFLLMASRRLRSDRFLTVDYRPGVYTPLGMDWIERGSMAGVLLRHCPELGRAVGSGKAAFAPWR
ncbi:MAG: peroxidase family protein, partial [Pseudonocardiaceae bacterium]